MLLGVGLTLATLLVLLFWRAVFQDRVLAPTDTIFTSAFFAEVAPEGFSRPSNPQLFDQVYQFAPWRHFAREAFASGELPLWNPHSLSGTPFVATQQTAIFHPYNLLLLLVPFERTFVVSAILRLLTAGVLTFLLARRLGVGPLASLFSALAFMLSGYLVVGVGHPHIGVAVWLPGTMLAAELILAARSASARCRSAALMALVVGIGFLGGHVETSVDILLGVGLYFLIRWHQLGWSRAPAVKERLSPLLLFAGGWVLGAGIGAAQLFPFLEWLPLSAEAGARAGGSAFVMFDVAALKNLAMLPLFVFPNLYNNPTWDPPYFNFLPWGRNFHSDMLFVGVLPFLLAIIAVVRCWRSNPVVRAWTVVALVALARALYLPVVDWLNQLPLLELGKPHLFRMIASFSVCLLAGFGADALFSEQPEEDRAGRVWRWLCGGVIIAGVAVMLAGKLILPGYRDRLFVLDRALAEEFHESIGGEPRPPDYFERQAKQRVRSRVIAFRLRNVAMYAPALIAGGALAVGLLARRRGWSLPLRGALLLLAAADLVGFAWDYNPTVARDAFYPAPPLLDPVLRDRTLFRFSATVRDLTADAHMMFDLSDIRGLDFPTRWYAMYAGLAPEHVRWRKITFNGFDSPLLRVLNLKYVFAATGRVPLAADHVARIYPAQRGQLWEVRDPHPRSFMVYDAVAAPTDSEAVRLLQERPEAVFSRVVLAADAAEVPAPPVQGGDRAAEVNVVEYTPRRSVWRVRTSRAGYLFTGDAFYPGWTAELDGQPTPLYRANLAFRAVYVPPGDHLVAHTFEPRSVRLGLVASLGSLAAAALLLMSPVRKRRDPAAEPVSGSNLR
jgi:hypothetical protein